MTQKLNLNISLDKTLAVTCDECGNSSFTQVLFLRRVSKFLAGTDEDSILPIPSFACSKCGHVNQEFTPQIGEA